jgi:hypothetical protein
MILDIAGSGEKLESAFFNISCEAIFSNVAKISQKLFNPNYALEK